MINWMAGSLFRGVSSWLPDSVAAVAGNALKGAVYGAVIGAAQSALTGGDIGKGALRGAAAGGVVSGVASSLGQLMGGDKFSTESQAASLRGDSKPNQHLATAGARPNTASEWMQNTYGDREPKTKQSGERWWQKDSDGGKLAAGILQGAAVGAGNYMTAQSNAESQEELADKRAAHEIALLEKEKELNKPTPPVTDYKIPRMEIAVRDWWQKRAMERNMA